MILREKVINHALELNNKARAFKSYGFDTNDYMVPKMNTGENRIINMRNSMNVFMFPPEAIKFSSEMEHYFTNYDEAWFANKDFLVYLIYTCVYGRIYNVRNPEDGVAYGLHWKEYYTLTLENISIDEVKYPLNFTKSPEGIATYGLYFEIIENALDDICQMSSAEVLERHKNKTLPNLYYTAMYCLYEVTDVFMPKLLSMDVVEPLMGLQTMFEVVEGTVTLETVINL